MRVLFLLLLLGCVNAETDEEWLQNWIHVTNATKKEWWPVYKFLKEAREAESWFTPCCTCPDGSVKFFDALDPLQIPPTEFDETPFLQSEPADLLLAQHHAEPWGDYSFHVGGEQDCPEGE